GADNNCTQALRKLGDAILRQPRAARAHQKARTGVVRDRVERARKHIRLHHHAGTAAGRRIIDSAMLVDGVRAYVDRAKWPDARSERLAGEAFCERARKHLRKDSQYARAPHCYSVSTGGTTTIWRASRSISGTVASVNGTSSGSPPVASLISMTSLAPKL